SITMITNDRAGFLLSLNGKAVGQGDSLGHSNILTVAKHEFIRMHDFTDHKYRTCTKHINHVTGNNRDVEFRFTVLEQVFHTDGNRPGSFRIFGWSGFPTVLPPGDLDSVTRTHIQPLSHREHIEQGLLAFYLIDPWNFHSAYYGNRLRSILTHEYGDV